MIKQIAFISILLLFSLVVPGCGDGGDKGACVPKAAPYSCGDDFTAGECDLMNGTFYSGKSCSAIGFRSS